MKNYDFHSPTPILPEVTLVNDLLGHLIFFVRRSASRILFVLWSSRVL
jgi:hypothetical protein